MKSSTKDDICVLIGVLVAITALIMFTVSAIDYFEESQNQLIAPVNLNVDIEVLR